MKMTKEGKKPIKTKPKTQILNHNDIFGNALSLTDEIKKDLEEQGLTPRFVDYKKLKEMDGYHEKGWTIYKKPKCDSIDNREFKFGSTPDGVVRRGSMVLAVKSKEQIALHRTYLKQKAERYSQAYTKKKASELRQIAKNSNVDVKIYEGYDDNG